MPAQIHSDEIVAIVNENDQIIGEMALSQVHVKGALHRECGCFLVNPKNQVLLQKRTDNHFWDYSSGGHFTKNENYEQGMRREFSEELGITLPASAFKGLAKLRLSHPNHYGMNNSFFRLFLVQQDIPLEKFRIDPKELEDIKYFTKTELADLLSRQDTMARTSKALLEKYIFPII